jgi:hypothetical protein
MPGISRILEIVCRTQVMPHAGACNYHAGIAGFPDSDAAAVTCVPVTGYADRLSFQPMSEAKGIVVAAIPGANRFRHFGLETAEFCSERV